MTNTGDSKKWRIRYVLGELPFCTTPQIARLFPTLKYPEKEASKYLKELEREKVVEGYDRRIGESKLWRLTLKARKELEIVKRNIPFTVRNIEHFLKIGDCYFDLKEMKGTWIDIELREEFTNRLEMKKNIVLMVFSFIKKNHISWKCSAVIYRE